MSALRSKLRNICDNNNVLECKLEQICSNAAYSKSQYVIIILNNDWIAHKRDISEWCNKNALSYEYIEWDEVEDEENESDKGRYKEGSSEEGKKNESNKGESEEFDKIRISWG
jgi:hypothetical protein